MRPAPPLLLTLTSLAALCACKASDSPALETSTGDSAATSSASSDTQTETETETGEAPPSCTAQSAAELMDCVESPRYVDDLEFVSDFRAPGSDHWQAVQDLCAERLTNLGYTVSLEDYGTGVNVIGIRLGTDSPETHVIVGAHYDHIPGCSGADDNGTGIAAILELARIFAEVPTPNSLQVTCWDEEELGLIGSAAQAQALLDAGTSVAGVFSLDSIGASSDMPNSQVVPNGFNLLFPDDYAKLEANEFRGDFLLWVSDDAMAPIGQSLVAFADQIGLNTLGTALSDDLKASPLLADLRRSDHASFWDVDIPAMFFNDTGEFRYSAYHCSDGTDDTVDKVDPVFSIQVAQVAVASVGVALGL